MSSGDPNPYTSEIVPSTEPAMSKSASEKYVDLSGVDSGSFPNPYDALIEACHDDPVKPLLDIRRC